MKESIPIQRSWVVTKYASQEDFENGVHFDIVPVDGNTLLSEGITEVFKLISGLTATHFGTANAFIGVGDSSAESSPTQTGLQASTNKFYKAVDSGFPVITGNDITWRATFASGEANFAWNEFTIANGNSDSAMNLNRKVSSQGSKTSGQIWSVNLTITFADSGTSGGGGGGGTPASGVLGYLGASLTMNAVEGAQTLGSLRFWNPIPTYSSGGIKQWVVDGLTNANPYWNSFNNALIAQPTNTFWLQLCALEAFAAQETYANAKTWVQQIKTRVPGAIVYVSAQPQYVPTHTCTIAGANGPDRMSAIVNQLVANGDALAGPIIGPWDFNTDLEDSCHANETGKAITGQQLIDFFYSIPGGVSGGGGGGGGTTYGDYPVGLYSLDQVVNKPFVSGVLKRIAWKNLETSQGVYNFSSIATTLNAAASAGQKMTLVVFTDSPTYVQTGASATYNAGNFGTEPVPWDSFAQQRWTALITALGNYVVGGYALKDHPNLAQVDCSVIGSQGIRLIATPAGYSLSLYQQACTFAVDTMATVFSKKIIYIGLFGIQGHDSDVRTIRDSLLATYNGQTLPRINFYQETLTGAAPSGTMEDYLLEVSTQTSIMWQYCWDYTGHIQSPSTEGEECTWETGTLTPQNALDHAALHGSTYIEVYVEDLNNNSYQTLFTNAAQVLQDRYLTRI